MRRTLNGILDLPINFNGDFVKTVAVMFFVD